MAKLKFKSTKIPAKSSVWVTHIVVSNEISNDRKELIRDLVNLLINETITEAVE